MRKLFASLLVLLAVLAVLPAAMAAGEEQEIPCEYIDLTETPAFSFFANAVWEDGWTCYGDQLTGDALGVYQALEAAFAADSVPLVPLDYGDGTTAVNWWLDKTAPASGTDTEGWVDEAYANVIKACEAFTFDHPEYFWIRRAMSFSYTYDENGQIWLSAGFMALPSCDTLEERDALQAELTPVINSILAEVEGKTTYGKLDHFDTWLAANNHYNHTAAGISSYVNIDDTPWSITGALLSRFSPVCEGYAKTFQLLCHKVGVPCLQLSGYANGESHMWTAVGLDGAWYFCDPTWDDPTVNGDSDRDYSTKEYFLTAYPASHVVNIDLTTPPLSAQTYVELVSGIDASGILTIVNGFAAGDGYTTNGEGWVWKDGTLTLEAVDGVTIKAVRFLSNAGSATVKLNSDFTLNADDVKDPAGEYWWDMQSALELERVEGTLTVQTGEYTLTCKSEADGIRSAGSLVLEDCDVKSDGGDNCIYVDCGNITIRNSTVYAEQALYGWGIYSHGIYVEATGQSEMGDLTMENSTVTVTSSPLEGSGNAIYADGDILIDTCRVDADGNNNGIGNDAGSIVIRNSTVCAVGEYLGICTYGTLTIEKSAVTAKTTTEGKSAIELCSWDSENEPPNVADFILNGCSIVTPEKSDIQLMSVKCGGGSMVWYDTVVTVADISDPDNVTAAMEVVIKPAKPTLAELLEQLIPAEGETVTAEQVRSELDGQAERIEAQLQADLSGDNAVLQRLKELEQAVTNDVEVISTHASIVSGEIVGGKLNAEQDGTTVRLNIGQAEDEHSGDGYSAMTAFSMKLEGAVDADPETPGQQLAVPVRITLPVPAHINPAFLLVLHYGGDGSAEEIKPYVYREDGVWYASFVVTGFSDFALAAVTIEADVTEGGVVVSADFAVALPGQAICAVYDEDGRMIGVRELETAELTAGEREFFVECDSAGAHTAKLFVLDGDGVPVYAQSPCVVS